MFIENRVLTMKLDSKLLYKNPIDGWKDGVRLCFKPTLFLDVVVYMNTAVR